MEIANRDLFAVTLDILKEDSEANREAIADLQAEGTLFRPIYSTADSCYWILESPFNLNVGASLTIGQEPILFTVDAAGTLVRHEWDYWFGIPGEGTDDPWAVTKDEIFRERLHLMAEQKDGAPRERFRNREQADREGYGRRNRRRRSYYRRREYTA